MRDIEDKLKIEGDLTDSVSGFSPPPPLPAGEGGEPANLKSTYSTFQR
jgi:hypothetical protein